MDVLKVADYHSSLTNIFLFKKTNVIYFYIYLFKVISQWSDEFKSNLSKHKTKLTG